MPTAMGIGQLRYDDPDLLLNKVARAKVQKYRDDYSASDVNKAFLPALFLLPAASTVTGNSCASCANRHISASIYPT